MNDLTARHDKLLFSATFERFSHRVFSVHILHQFSQCFNQPAVAGAYERYLFFGEFGECFLLKLTRHAVHIYQRYGLIQCYSTRCALFLLMRGDHRLQGRRERGIVGVEFRAFFMEQRGDFVIRHFCLLRAEEAVCHRLDEADVNLFPEMIDQAGSAVASAEQRENLAAFHAVIGKHRFQAMLPDRLVFLGFLFVFLVNAAQLVLHDGNFHICRHTAGNDHRVGGVIEVGHLFQFVLVGSAPCLFIQPQPAEL